MQYSVWDMCLSWDAFTVIRSEMPVGQLHVCACGLDLSITDGKNAVKDDGRQTTAGCWVYIELT
jgi:hypothetical protein